MGAFSGGMAKALGGGLHVRVITGAMEGGLGAAVAGEDVGYGVWLGTAIATVAYLYNDFYHRDIRLTDIYPWEYTAKEMYLDLISMGFGTRAKAGLPLLKGFAKLGIKYTDHFLKRVLGRVARGITERNALEAYSTGRLYYNPATKNFIRHQS